MGLSESISAFTKGVGGKMKGNAEVISIRNQIADEQKQLVQFKEKLGGRFYELYKDRELPEAELNDMIANIRFHEQKVLELEKQAAEIRQAMESVSFKAEAGTGYGEFKGAKPGNRFCTNCGAPLVEGQSFCVNCGAKL
ncbi:MAG: zinc ribbon domain-containing protein [Lachnospiraceae bacterium]|nr:zinc ribbon domain-containing protein [Lachnospiraceae bacterium]